jgi:hypothetical protein
VISGTRPVSPSVCPSASLQAVALLIVGLCRTSIPLILDVTSEPICDAICFSEAIADHDSLPRARDSLNFRA